MTHNHVSRNYIAYIDKLGQSPFSNWPTGVTFIHSEDFKFLNVAHESHYVTAENPVVEYERAVQHAQVYYLFAKYILNNKKKTGIIPTNLTVELDTGYIYLRNPDTKVIDTSSVYDSLYVRKHLKFFFKDVQGPLVFLLKTPTEEKQGQALHDKVYKMLNQHLRNQETCWVELKLENFQSSRTVLSSTIQIVCIDTVAEPLNFEDKFI